MAYFASCLDVIPAKAGIHLASRAIKDMDSRLRGNDAWKRGSVFIIRIP